LPSLPALISQGCFGWKRIAFTPSMLRTECPLSTLSGRITAYWRVSDWPLKWKTWIVASLLAEAMSGYSGWKWIVVTPFSWKVIDL